MTSSTDASRPSLARHFSLWLSFIHAVVVLIVVPICFYHEITSDSVQALWMRKDFSEKTYGQQLWATCEILQTQSPNIYHFFLSAFAGIYYTIDLITIFANVHPLDITAKMWYSAHHILCFAGLVAPVYFYNSAWDTDLAYVGFWVGEVSNPPRCIVDLLQYQIDTQPSANGANVKSSNGSINSKSSAYVTVFGTRYNVARLQSWMATSQRIHLILFIIFRFVGIHYFVNVVYYHAKYFVTNFTGGTTLVLSLIAMAVMIQNATATTPKPVGAETAQEEKANGKKKETKKES